MPEVQMLGMNFMSFLTLLVISVVVSAVLHFGLKYYVTADIWSFCSKVVVGWLGAWLGSPVFGYWFPDVAVDGVFVIPAILGALAMIVVAVDIAKMFSNRA